MHAAGTDPGGVFLCADIPGRRRGYSAGWRPPATRQIQIRPSAGRLFLCRLRVTSPAAVCGVLFRCGICILARRYDGVAGRWWAAGGICGRLYARGRHGRRPPETTIFWKTARFSGLFLQVRGRQKIRPDHRKNSKVAKVAGPKVANKNQAHIVVSLIVVKVAAYSRELKSRESRKRAKRGIIPPAAPHTC